MLYARRWRNKTNLTKLTVDTSSEDALMTCLRQKSVITRTARIVQEPRIFLSCYMIVYYPNMILGHNVFDYYLRQKADNLLTLFASLKSHYTWRKYVLFQWRYYQFKKYFLKWKKQDKEKISIPLVYEYWDLDNLKNHYDNDDLEAILRHQREILSKLQRMFQDPMIILNKYKDKRPSLEEEIAESFYNKWMRDLHKDLMEQKYERVPSLIEDIMKLVKECVPNNHRYVTDVEERLDPAYIGSLIENTYINAASVQALILFVMEVIRELEAPDMDADTDMAVSLLKDMFQREFKYADILCFFFQTAFMKLEVIRKRRIEILGQ